MSEIKHGNFKISLILANEHQSDQKTMQHMIFIYIFAMYLFMQRRLCQRNARKCSIKEDFNQTGSVSIS